MARQASQGAPCSASHAVLLAQLAIMPGRVETVSAVAPPSTALLDVDVDCGCVIAVQVCFGTTKYCNAFLKGLPCNNPECLYLHEIGKRPG